MKLINEGNGNWGVERDGVRVVTGESYQVASNICEPTSGWPDEASEVAEAIKPASDDSALSHYLSVIDDRTT